MEAAASLIYAAQLWIYAGTGVALLFLLIGIDRIDEDARGAYTFRPLLVPGIILLWPFVVWRWALLEAGWNADTLRDRPLRKAHAWVWLVLAILIPAIFIGAIAIRQPTPAADGAVRLSPPTK